MRSKPGNEEPVVELRDVTKKFDNVAALVDVTLAVFPGEFLSLLGPSGSGKSTTLRLIAGFEEPSSGQVLIQGHSMSGVPPERRPTNTVFQSYALFPHLTVFDNIAFGLQAQRRSKAEIEERVRESLALVQLRGLENRYIQQLSGGQQQRVALARAIINEPAVLLLDEPLGALDLKLRRQMQLELKELQRRLGVTFIYVTHDQEEALSMSDRIAVLNQGRVDQVGTGQQLYREPATPFVAGFVGEVNLLPGELVERQQNKGTVRVVEEILVGRIVGDVASGADVLLSVRPEKIQLALKPLAGYDNNLSGHVTSALFLGHTTAYYLALDETTELQVRCPPQEGEAVSGGQRVWAAWSVDDCLVLPTR